MSVAKIFTGARAQMFVKGQLVGIFNNVTYGIDYDAAPAFILGRYSPAEITYTGQEAISVTATGWRVIDNGPHVAAAVPRLQDLLTHDDITLTLHDRESTSPNPVMTVVGVRPTGYNITVSQKAQSEITVRFLGLRLEDESSGPVNETPGASDL